ncbi:MAG: hypothetical protein HYU29_08730 [Chloroflexi bacterium]|nr:hypothetical protein [Chloroflexota bacterium]
MEKEEKLKELLGQEYEELMAWKAMKWVGPFTVDDLLESCLDNDHPWPPKSNSVYLVSRNLWDTLSVVDSVSLYVGSNTGKSPRFCTRIGDLIADLFGFFQEGTGHSSGGISLHNYCKKQNLNPKQLHIAWIVNCGCVRCAETVIYDLTKPELNIKRPPKCIKHHGKEQYSAAFRNM